MIILGPALVVLGIGFLSWLLLTSPYSPRPLIRHDGLLVGDPYRSRRDRRDRRWSGRRRLDLRQWAALAFAPWAWLRLLIVFAYVVPATVAGYSTTHGFAQMTMPSPVWQIIFAFIGAIAIGITAFICIMGMASPGAEPTAGTATTLARRRRDGALALSFPARAR